VRSPGNMSSNRHFDSHLAEFCRCYGTFSITPPRRGCCHFFSRRLGYFESGPSTVPDVNSSPTVPSSAESSVLSFTDKQEG